MSNAVPRMDAADCETVYRKALAAWGADAQINQCMEEFGEAAAAMNRYRRGRASLAAVADEIADAAVMVEQMRLLFGPDLVDAARQKKLRRLEHRLAITETA